METTNQSLNVHDLESELTWLSSVLDARFASYFTPETAAPDLQSSYPPPDLSRSRSPFAAFVRTNQLRYPERLALILVLATHLRPRLLDVFFLKNSTFDRKFTEFGGVFGGPDGDFTPTGETLAFILGADDLATRFDVQEMLRIGRLFTQHNVLAATSVGQESVMKGALEISAEYLSLFTNGHAHRPAFGVSFPARHIETQLTWDDLVLDPRTRQQIEEIETWLQHGETLMQVWGMAPKLRPGYRSLFYGPPGTGKTMTACLLGKSTGRDVYKVDLSLIVSKYIGETEKNLAKVFDQAENREWILFFDEADALFGKRSRTKDAHDRYANQEVSFLLQRIETFNGIAILASNRRDDLDEAFARRFESIIHFPLPRPDERLRLWRQGFSPQATLAPALDLNAVAQQYELSGGSIMNVIRFASLEALKQGNNVIAEEAIRQGIRREYIKEGRIA